MVDQRRIDNQRSRSSELDAADTYLTAKEAARFLGVKLATVYAYASRGLLRAVPRGGGGRARLYARSDLDRLRARHDARSGHGAVAGGALRFGEPVLESAITAIAPEGPRYRGHAAVDLARAATGFERVAELLWTGALPDAERAWAERPPRLPLRAVAKLVPAGARPLDTMLTVLPLFAAHDPARHGAPPQRELARARALVRAVAIAPALARDPALAENALDAPTIAGALLVALGARPSRGAVALADRALVVAADHELNPSSFAARVTASTGADLYACATAALATATGPHHAGMTERVEALVDEVGRPERARATIELRGGRGEAIPGFSHPLYPEGDPRGRALVDAVREAGAESTRVRVIVAIADAMEAVRGERPTIDFALVAVAAALRLGPGAAGALFATGRTAGWIAHALEQRSQGFVLRPRARYVGV